MDGHHRGGSTPSQRADDRYRERAELRRLQSSRHVTGGRVGRALSVAWIIVLCLICNFGVV